MILPSRDELMRLLRRNSSLARVAGPQQRCLPKRKVDPRRGTMTARQLAPSTQVSRNGRQSSGPTTSVIGACDLRHPSHGQQAVG